MTKKKERIYTMQMTQDEVLMLQRVIKEERKTTYAEYTWEAKLRDSLQKKANNLYQKPKISKKDYDKAVEKERTKWPDEALGRHLANAEKIRLEFYYDVERTTC